MGWGEGQLRTDMGLQGRGVAADCIGSWQPMGSVLSHKRGQNHTESEHRR